MEKHLPNMQGYADDRQLYLSFRPSSSEEMDRALSALCAAITEVRAWLISHKLKFNDTKTEFIIIGTRQQLAKVEVSSVKVGTADIAPLTSIRNLGAWFDDKMSINDHINKICSKASEGFTTLDKSENLFQRTLKVQNDILLSMDRQEVTLLVLLDLSAAFDTIDHNLLLDLLQSDFGVIGSALHWVRSFLSERQQRVVVGQSCSKDYQMEYGVP